MILSLHWKTYSKGVTVMSITREEIEATLLKFQQSRNYDLHIGALTAIYDLIENTGEAEENELRQELVTSIVYLQTAKVHDKMGEVALLTRGIREVMEISDEQLLHAQKVVEAQIEKESKESSAQASAQAKESEESNNETKSDESTEN